MDITKVTAAPKKITLCGREFEIQPSIVDEVGEFTAWLQDKLPNPITAVMEALQSPAVRTRDRWAALAVRTWQKAYDQVLEAVRTQQPTLKPEELFALAKTQAEAEHADLWLEAELANEWKQERRQLQLKAYHDAYGPKPELDDPIWQPILQGSVAMAYELWLSLRHKHGDEFPTHWHVLQFLGQNVEELRKARLELAKLNDPDPAKNSSARPETKADAG